VRRRNPMTGTGGCCARAGNGHAAPPPSKRDEGALVHVFRCHRCWDAADRFVCRSLRIGRCERPFLGADLKCSESGLRGWWRRRQKLIWPSASSHVPESVSGVMQIKRKPRSEPGLQGFLMLKSKGRALKQCNIIQSENRHKSSSKK
jgi:hypothetical protein